MQIEIGNKIRQLRQRDGRKQEDLANALGVTNQAVSRWEASGGYPDMEMIPAIANYFNVSIDELFGYSSDRQAKLQSILVRAEKAINEQGDMTECVEMLRSAAEEFPSEPQVLIKLGYALSMHGWKKYGARSYTKDGSDYAHEDTEYNGGNIYWQEEIKVFEKVLGMDIPAEDRDTIVMMMVITYAKMGYYDKAKALAASRDSIISSRELLLTKAADAEERDRYCGEAIIALLTEIKRVIVYAVSTKVPLFTSPESIRLFLGLANLYESVFSDGRCGVAHSHICDLYLHAAIYEARFGEGAEKALEYFRKAYEHNGLYNSIRCEGNDEYKYTAPLFSRVTFPSENFPTDSDMPWKSWLELIPDNLKELIKADPQLKECFE